MEEEEGEGNGKGQAEGMAEGLRKVMAEGLQEGKTGRAHRGSFSIVPLSSSQALSATREARACVSPRAGFVVQLLTWENILKLWKAGKQGKALQLPPIKDMHLHLPPINGL